MHVVFRRTTTQNMHSPVVCTPPMSFRFSKRATFTNKPLDIVAYLSFICLSGNPASVLQTLSDAPWQSRCRLGPSAVGSSSLPIESRSRVPNLGCSIDAHFQNLMTERLHEAFSKSGGSSDSDILGPCAGIRPVRGQRPPSVLRPNPIRHST